jgi:hypothetical protein
LNMHTDDAIRAEMRGRGRRIKRNNLVAASLSGAVLACVSLNFFPHSVIGISAGLAAGLVYANGFEYVLHRLVLHSGRGIFCRQHMVHHTTLQSPDASLSTTWPLRKFTGARTWAAGCRNGCALLRAIICCITPTTQAASTCSFLCLTGCCSRHLHHWVCITGKKIPASDPSLLIGATEPRFPRRIGDQHRKEQFAVRLQGHGTAVPLQPGAMHRLEGMKITARWKRPRPATSLFRAAEGNRAAGVRVFAR